MPSRRKPEEVVTVLLTRLERAKEYARQTVGKEKEQDLQMKFKAIGNEIASMKRLFSKIKQWEGKLMEQIKTLEQQIDDDIFKEKDKDEEIFQSLDLISDNVVSIKHLFSQVERQLMDRMTTMLPSRLQQSSFEEASQVQVMSKEWMSLRVEERIFAGKTMLNFRKSFDCLGSNQLKACSLCLSIFPENNIITKKPLIYWWMGEGLVTKTNQKTAEEVGEAVVKELIDEGFVIPKGEKSAPNNVNSFMVHPWIRRMLISEAKGLEFFDFDSTWTQPRNRYRRSFLLTGSANETDEETLTVFNVNEKYLEFKSDWLSKLNRVEVLQLGRWKSDVKHHIEVDDEDPTFDPKRKKVEYGVSLNGLGNQKFLKYLSLRGVSRITMLPLSLAKLVSLEILDLRACHNLEKLPPNISSLRKLTHLDVSECYLLESMPKGIEELSALEVLKGFVIGNVRDNPCKISDLAELKYLRKLSIRIGSQALGEGELANLKNFKALQILEISWGAVNTSTEAAFKSLSIPPMLRKLDLWCVPIANAPEWLGPGRLTTLEKLYVRGGELGSFCRHDGHTWKVKSLILKYLKNFKIEKKELLDMFPEVKYLEKFNCYKDDQDFILKNPKDKEAISTRI